MHFNYPCVAALCNLVKLNGPSNQTVYLLLNTNNFPREIYFLKILHDE